MKKTEKAPKKPAPKKVTAPPKKEVKKIGGKKRPADKKTLAKVEKKALVPKKPKIVAKKAAVKPSKKQLKKK